MSKTITVEFTEVQLKAVAQIINLVEKLDYIPIDTESDVVKGVRSFDKAINKAGYFREDGEIFKL